MSDGKVMKPAACSRRSFLLSSGPTLTGAWLAANWPTIVAAAQHSHSSAQTAPETFTFFRPAEVAGRLTTWRKDDTRLHIDAFPASLR